MRRWAVLALGWLLVFDLEQEERYPGFVSSARRAGVVATLSVALAEQMHEEMATRAVIEQAKGVLVARTGCTPDEAFASLVQRSRTQGRTLALIAAEAVDEAQQARPT